MAFAEIIKKDVPDMSDIDSTGRRRTSLGGVLACALVSAVALAGLGTATVACTGDKSSTSEASAKQKPLRIAWSYWLGYSPILIGLERGLFQKHGLTFDPVEYDVSAKQMPDFEAGLLDGGLFAYADALTLSARQRDAYRVILVCDNSNGADVIVASAEIAAVSDLRGKRIGAGVGSFGELLVRTMLAKNGLTVKDVELINMSAEGVPDALERNLVDAGQTWDPFAAKAVNNGNHLLFSSAETPGLIPDILLVRKEVVEKRPDELRQFVRGWFEAVSFIQQNEAAAKEIIARRTKKSVSSINLAGVRILDRQDNLDAFQKPDSPLSLRVSAETNLEFMLSTGALTDKPDLEQLLDSSIVATLDSGGATGQPQAAGK